MNKIIIILLMILCVSCSKRNEVESIFIANKNEYWEHYDHCFNSGGNYFQFDENGTYDVYLQYIDKGFKLFNNDGDLINDSRTWSIKNDSVFVWNNEEYKIEKITNREILLSYYHYKIKDKHCFVSLLKWVKTPQGPKPLDELDNIKK